MIRYFGIILVSAFCMLIGRYYAESFKREYKKVCRACDMLFEIKAFISFDNMTFFTIIESLYSKECYSCILPISSLWQDKDSFLKALTKSKPFINDELNDRLERIFKLLGTTDKQTQIELINNEMIYFEKQADILRGQLPVKQKLYTSLGLASGALAAVILL